MRRTLLSRTHQGDLFARPAKLPELPAEVRQKIYSALYRGKLFITLNLSV